MSQTQVKTQSMSQIKLKPLREQVIVITGASSGIGLATARMAAAEGARLVLAGRSDRALTELVTEITAKGGHAIHVIADVGREEDVRRIAEAALTAFGHFDTWVNDAGIGVYGRMEEVSIEDMRRCFETNFWSQIYGSREAVKHLKQQGGALINLGSEVSERAVPLQGIYCASKHAIKGMTEALRMELEAEGAPISVTLIKPGQIDTPFTVNAKNYLDSEPHHVPPVYAPEAVAEAILHAAETPVRDVFVGGGARVIAAMGHAAPGLTDRFMEKTIIPGTPSGHAPRRAHDQSGLDTPTEALTERGNYEGHVMKTSLYTRAVLNPLVTGTVMVGVGLVLMAGWRRRLHSPATMRGSNTGTVAKALRIVVEARPGKEGEVQELLAGIRQGVGSEPGARPWFGLQRNESVFEIFETFPDEAGREAHLAGKGAALLMGQSSSLLAKPAVISKLDILITKTPSAAVHSL